MPSRERQPNGSESGRWATPASGSRFACRILGVCLFLGLACSVAAARNQVLQGHHHTAWTSENGLSAVWAIQQAPNGFLWLTTSRGVYRFDGQRFESTDEVTNRQVHDADVVTVFPSPSGGVWLTTRSHGLLLWKDNRVTSYPDIRCEPDAEHGIVEDRDGVLWIAAYSGLFRLKNGACEEIHNKPAFPNGFPLAILLDRAGTIWVKWPTGDFYFMKRGESSFTRWAPGEDAGTEYAILQQAPDGSIWLSDAGGLRRITGGPDPTTPIAAAAKIRKPPSGFGNFAFAPDGSLWAASGLGVYRFNNVAQYKVGELLSTADGEAFTVKQGLSASTAPDVFIDKEGTVWIGTTSGLDQLRRSVFSTLAMPQTTDHQFAIAAGDDGSVWVGNREQPLTHISRDGHVQVFEKTRQCIAIRRAFDGSIWSSGIGEARLWRTTRDEPLPVAFPPGDVRSATDIAVDRNHEPWITTFTPDSYHRVGTTWTSVTNALGKDPGIIGSMAGDSSGNLWFAFSNKLVEWDGSTYHRFSFPDKDLNITAAVISVRGDHVWLGGAGGVVLFSHGHFQLMHWKDEDNPGRVSGLVETKAGELWINGTTGVIRVPANELKNWLDDSHYGVSADRFDPEDGLPGFAEERWPEPSVVESTSGILWFATDKGVAWIDPETLRGRRNRVAPAVFVNNVIDKGKMYSATKGLLALPARGNLEFNYTALSLAVPERVLFRYKLEGIDTDWQSAGARRQAFYTNLPPGKYRFHVIACNNDGVWNEEGAYLDFVIPPAWYQTIWFQALCLIGFCTLLWTAYQLRVHELQEQEKKFRDAVETMPALAFVADPRGSRTFLNRGWLEYAGLSSEHASGSGWQAAVHPDDLKRVNDRWSNSLATGDPLDYEARLRRGSDGTYRWFQTRARPLRDDRGKIVKWCGVANDIEDRKRAEQLQADLTHASRVSTMGELVASISHELAQPITATANNAKASLRWLQSEPPDLNQVRKGTESIIEASKFASEIINRLRSLYKKAPSKREFVSIRSIVAEMAGMMRGEARGHGISIRTDLDDDLPMTVADRVQLQQVFMNLILNGIEAMKETGGVLSVKVHLCDNGDIEVAVKDTGPGLPPDRADQIFDAFFTTKPEGSGMGLAICKSIIESQGGRIWADSNSGRGATFHFTLPTVKSSSA
jgi:PAS domain S-box-containing protein